MARRPALTTLALAALAAAAIVAAVLVVGSPAASSAQERTATVERGVIQSTVSGSGNLKPANEADVDFATSGEITHIYVEEGQHVSKDDILAKVDPASANVDLAQAEADLQSAQDALVQAQTPATTTATAAQSSGSKGAGSGSSSASSSGSSSGSGSGSGATGTMTVAAAQANVDSAQLSVESAEKAVAATTLRAPMAGTVTAVNGSVGQTVSGGSSSSSSSSTGASGASVAGGLGGGGASSSSSSASGGSGFITLAQVSRFKMEVSLSESDIGSVKVGQPATVTVNAASGEQFAARVADIGVLSSSSSSGSSSSAVSYPVTLSLDQTGKSLKAGMSATADIVTSQVTGLAVPSQALSGSTVTVEAADGTQTTQRVQTGVVGDATTQVISGLKAGDKVVVRSAAATLGAGTGGANQLNSAIGSRLGGGGLGGGLGGGGFGAGGGGFRAGGGGGGRTP